MSPDGVEFQHVSPKLATLRLGNALAACGALCGAISGLVLIVDIPALWWLMLVPAAIALLCLWLVPAQVRADLVPGPVASMAEHVEAGRSLELWARLSEASKVRREAEAPERWLSRVTEIVEATSQRAEGDK